MSLTDPLLVVGHRGAAGIVPENTLPSFRRAFECGVGAIELDVYVVDGELIVIHDDTLERTTNGVGRLRDQDLGALRRLNAGGGWPIPLLSEVAAILPAGVGLNIELKGPDTAAPVADFLARENLPDVLVSSFEHAELETFHRLAPDVRVAPLFDRWTNKAWAVAERFGAWGINLSRKIATAERLAQARSLGLRTVVYTVNDLEQARMLVENGATGIFTDFPDRITVDRIQSRDPA